MSISTCSKQSFLCFNVLEKKKILILCSHCNIKINDKESEFLIEISDMKRNTTKVIIPIIKGNNINKLNQSQKLTDFNTKIVDEMDYDFDYGKSSIQISKNSFLN